MYLARLFIVLTLVVPSTAQAGVRTRKRERDQFNINTSFTGEVSQEDVDFWDRELGSKGSVSKRNGKGGSKGSKGSKSKGYKSYKRALVESEFMREVKEDVDFWHRELGSKGSASKGIGGSKGSKGSKSKKESKRSKSR